MKTEQNEATALAARAVLDAIGPAPWSVTLPVGAAPVRIGDVEVWADRDDAGKMRLMAKVGSGNPIQLAVEP
jgi:hypothetical protein